jgi:hypothetical protein|tara:strand:+ start:429 stop:2444 length:2016 start_codon:yes stop_codon:yes gene_type:complete
MSNVRNLLLATAGSAGGAGLDVDEVFSTFQYFGNGGSGNNIVNGIDLSTEGGLVWFKRRNGGNDHFLVDNVRGLTKYLVSNSNTSGSTHSNVTYNTNGFTLNDNLGDTNESNQDYISWSFRKAPKFFDIVTYTGDGSTTKTVSHNLGSTPGMILFKRTDDSGNWIVYHANTPASGYTQAYMRLNGDFHPGGLGDYGNSLAPTSSVIRTPVHSNSGNTADSVNVNNATYTAYIFAHNNSDGEFGPDADKDIIKCGAFTRSTSTTTTIDLGFEPQWILVKKTSSASGNWYIVDAIRGLTFGGAYDEGQAELLSPNTSTNGSDGDILEPTATGFQSKHTHQYLDGGESYIYVAIRRGPLAPPTDATKVFAIDQGDSSNDDPQLIAGFPVDMGMFKQVNNTDSWVLGFRQSYRRFLNPDKTGTGGSNAVYAFDFQNGWLGTTLGTDWYSWMWRRAPGFFDVVCYEGNNSSGRSINHNLGVVPEMIWIKNRGYGDSSNGEPWTVYHKGNNGGTDPEDYALRFSGNAESNVTDFNDTAPTASIFKVSADRRVNGSASDNNTYVAFLFATVAGVSKVGSYTGNASTNTIDCGFSNGARFVLVKNTKSSGFVNSQRPWVLFDSTRGIVSGNDPYLLLSENNAASNADWIDPHSSGFQLTGTGGNDANASGGTYVFLAIA